MNKHIESLLNGQSLHALAKERKKLTQDYKGQKEFYSESQKLAYLASRLPATKAVIQKVFAELIQRTGICSLRSVLDIGSGPGTVLLALSEMPISLNAATLIEKDPGFLSLAKQLTQDIAVQKTFIQQDITQNWNVKPHELVIASYCLNELEQPTKQIEKLWDLSERLLILIEPGTKKSFNSLKILRQILLSKGAHLIAPCPHSNACPMAEDNWCHFHARLQRNSLLRKTKEATLNYEDEKFSYLIFSRIAFNPCASRILRRPIKGKGFIKLQICSKNEIENKTITKKDKINYSPSKKLKCGDEYINLL